MEMKRPVLLGVTLLSLAADASGGQELSTEIFTEPGWDSKRFCNLRKFVSSEAGNLPDLYRRSYRGIEQDVGWKSVRTRYLVDWSESL